MQIIGAIGFMILGGVCGFGLAVLIIVCAEDSRKRMEKMERWWDDDE